MRVPEVRQDATWTLGATVGSVALSLSTGILTARIFGPDGRGAVAAIQTLPLIVASVCVLGMPDAAIYATASGRPRGPVIGSALVIASVGACVGGLALFAVAPWALAAQTEAVVEAARWHIVLLFAAATTGVLVSALRGTGHPVTWNLFRLTPQAAWAAVLLLAMVTGRLSAVSATLLFLGLRLLIAVPETFICLKKIGSTPTVSRPEIRTLLRYGGPLTLASLPALVSGRIDQALLAALVPASELGYYVVAVTWSTAVVPLVSVGGWLVFPRLAAMSVSERYASAPKLLRAMSGVSVLAGLGVGLSAPIAVPLVFGEAFRPAVPLAVLLSAGSVPLVLSQFATDVAKGLNATKLTVTPQLIGAGITVAGLALLVPSMGVLGAAWVSVAAYCGAAFLIYRGLSRLISIPIGVLVIPDVRALAMLVWSRYRNG